ncbi:uncharacterized protein LOC133792235 [Humulus lupulus]|uniref:uncharacterized protein LOC133792235 n=1 Tax=Humulus lupulus TaxID=3486 RepID=UPI002B40D558|nr:uncharacterized protein LOC133792235 [Humulus lupulus]
MVDKFTRERSRVQFARVLVEMNITDNSPRIIQYLNDIDCRKGMKTQWVKKEVQHKITTEEGSDKGNQLTVDAPDLIKGSISATNAFDGKKISGDTWQTPKKVVLHSKLGQTDIDNISAAKVQNGQGQNNKNTFEVLQGQVEGETGDICRSNKVGVGALLETKMRGNKVTELMTHKLTNWDFYSSPVTEGRILIIWRKIFVRVIVIEETNQYVHYHKELKKVVLDSWRKPINGTGLKAIYLKTMRLKHSLKKFNRDNIGDIGVNYQKAKDRYQEAQLQAQKHPRDSVFQEIEAAAVVAFNVQEQISFMGIPSSTTTQINLQCIETGNKLSVDQQLSLLKPFSYEEIKTAFFSIPINKSLGPDGFGYAFFKVLWLDIGGDICRAVGHFNETGQFPSELHNTTISLVPKTDNPARAVDYRPIACCSIIYKCISKLLCSRLDKDLPSLVQQNQGAFIQGRSIAHNILIFQDLIKNYGKKTTSPRCAIKIDLSKAYDTVDWWFLEELLKSLCFPMRFIGWIMTCLKNTTYSLLMNGRVQGSFKGEKGKRQGDPISPLIFVLIMGYLTRRLQLVAQRSTFRYHPMWQSLKLLSLCFADDLILFFKGTQSTVRVLKVALEEFSSTTGLHVNTSNSHIYFGGVTTVDRKTIAHEIQLSEGSFPLKYLGVPMQPTKWKPEDCGIIIQKIKLSVVKEVEKLCRGFLWGLNGNRSKIHIASWKKVCLPKAYGGLGFKDGSNWNRVILAKYIWAISEKHDLLWVKWINSVYLKDSNFWDYKLKSDSSWYWRKIGHLRGKFSQFEVSAAGLTRTFRASKLYSNSLCQQQVDYQQVVWCKMSLLKHRFLLWQVVNAHLLTRDLMIRGTEIDAFLMVILGLLIV